MSGGGLLWSLPMIALTTTVYVSPEDMTLIQELCKRKNAEQKTNLWTPDFAAAILFQIELARLRNEVAAKAVAA